MPLLELYLTVFATISAIIIKYVLLVVFGFEGNLFGIIHLFYILYFVDRVQKIFYGDR